MCVGKPVLPRNPQLYSEIVPVHRRQCCRAVAAARKWLYSRRSVETEEVPSLPVYSLRTRRRRLTVLRVGFRRRQGTSDERDLEFRTPRILSRASASVCLVFPYPEKSRRSSACSRKHFSTKIFRLSSSLSPRVVPGREGRSLPMHVW